MYKLLSLCALALIFVAPAAMAQDQGNPQAADLNIKSEKIGDWIVHCAEGKDGELADKPNRGRCEMSQSLSRSENGQRVAEMNIGFPSGAEGAVGVVALPLGVMLPYGGTIRIDEGEAKRFAYRSCEPKGCFALVALNDDVLKEMRKGNKAHVGFMLPNGEKPELPFSLNGFTKALKEISKQ